MKYLFSFFITLSFLFCFFIDNEANASSEPDNGYIDELIDVILAKTDTPDAAKRRVIERTDVSRGRKLAALIEGELIEYSAMATSPKWEENLITIRIPLRKGLQGYRLFFIRQRDQETLKKINSIQDFKKLPTGSGTQWSTRLPMEQVGFVVINGDSKENLFKMLEVGRFTTFGRGIDEIFFEHEQIRNEFPDVVIDTHIALYIPKPTYIFVSPKRPDLAKRFEDGLRKMMQDGSFDEIFYKYFADDLKKAGLHKRKIFQIPNPALTPDTPLETPEYWLDPAAQPPS